MVSRAGTIRSASGRIGKTVCRDDSRAERADAAIFDAASLSIGKCRICVNPQSKG